MIKVAVALDESAESLTALEWAVKAWDKEAVFQLVTVVLPVVTPTVPLGVEADMLNAGEWTLSPEQERKAVKVAEDAVKFAVDELKLPKDRVTSHVLRPTGGASGVGESIVAFAKQEHPQVLVMGSRSLNGIQRTFMGLLGAGSVSDYVLHNVHVPVLAVHYKDLSSAGAPPEEKPHPSVESAAAEVELEALSARKRQVVVSLDSSETSMVALHWAFKYLIHEGDVLHLMCVCLPPPLPVLDEVTAMMTEPDPEQAQHGHWEAAQAVVARAAAIAAGRGIPETHIVQHIRLPQGGASGVGESITQYSDHVHADVVVLGSRGMGAVQAALMNFIGLGSVSEYVMHHSHSPVLVIKHDSLSAVA